MNSESKMRTGRVLLIFGGGIAAYKSLELIRLIRDRGLGVAPVMTRAAQEFVTPLSAASLAGEKTHIELFALTDEVEMGHIELSRSADLLVVAPATADLMAKMAHGRADDLASTLLLATDKPVLIAPAMNVRMWEHPATQRNLAQLEADGVRVVGPNEGAMACGEFGPGRMAEPADIMAAIQRELAGEPGDGAALAGLRVVVTSGPTHEPIDPVRYIANRSSGRQGVAIAEALAARGAEVVFVTGPAACARPAGCRIEAVETAEQMLAAVRGALPADVAIFAAAVADWRIEARHQKIKKSKGAAPPSLRLVENPDILATIAGLEPPGRPDLVVGFAAETEHLRDNATAKRARKGCDWLLANDVSPGSGVMGGAENEILFLTDVNEMSWPRMNKEKVAERLADEIVAWRRSKR